MTSKLLSFQRFSALRCAIAALLATSAALKVASPGALPLPFRSVPGVEELLIAWEVLVAILLMSESNFIKGTCIITAVTFAIFSVASAYSLVLGKGCGCLGTIAQPRTVLAIDVAVLGAVCFSLVRS